MGKRTSYAPGTFSWVDLATTDAAAATAFYGELFGWEPADTPAGEGRTYTMLRLDGDDVGALFEMGPEMRARGVPPTWTSYVTVEDANAVAARTRELGGAVHAEPFDVMQAGRMALLEDPAGAMFAVWQPREHAGAGRVNDPGCLCINELATTNIETAARFYGDLFGWETEPIDTGGGPQYAAVRNGGNLNANVSVAEGGAPPHWRPYFTVLSIDDAVGKILGGGGQVLAGPIDIPAGRIAVALDPQGAVFALFEGEVDP
jgi:hypothetical protein